jgi:hypothetical protein
LRDSHHFAVAVSLSWSRRAAPFAPACMCLSQASDLRCRGGDVRGLEAALPGQIWRRSRAGLSIRFSFGRPYSSGLAGTGFAVLICHNGRQCRKGFRVFNQIARVVVTGRQRLGAEKIGDSATWRFAVSLTANGRPAKASADRHLILERRVRQGGAAAWRGGSSRARQAGRPGAGVVHAKMRAAFVGMSAERECRERRTWRCGYRVRPQ